MENKLKRKVTFEFSASPMDENSDLIDNHFFEPTLKGISEFFDFADDCVKTQNVWLEIKRYNGNDVDGVIDYDQSTIEHSSTPPYFRLPYDLNGYSIPNAIKARFIKAEKIYRSS